VFRPMLLPDLSALLALKQPLTPEVTSLARRPGGDGQLGGTSTLSGYCNNGWKRRRYRRGQGRALDDNRFDCAATDNGTVLYTPAFALFFPKTDDTQTRQDLSYRKQIARQLRTQYVEGI